MFRDFIVNCNWLWIWPLTGFIHHTRATNRTLYTKNMQYITRSTALAVKSQREFSQSILFKLSQDCSSEYSDVMC